MKQDIPLFILIQKQKQLSMKVILMICLNQSIPQLYKALVIDHIINISKYNTSVGSSYIKLPKKLISIPNFDDNECFKWCVVTYLHPADHHLAINRKIPNLFGDELDFKDIKFPVKIKDISKIYENNFIGTDVFDYENKKKKYLIYVSKNTFKKHVDLFLLQEKDKSTILLSKILIHL